MKNSLTNEDIRDILSDSKIEFEKWGEKTTVVKCKLPNGFIIIESSSCVDPINYSEEIGRQICLQRIENKVWELEGYKLQSEVSKHGKKH